MVKDIYWRRFVYRQRSNLFFFLTPNDNTLYYSADIPNIYDISEDVYSDLEFELYLKFKNLNNEFSKEKLIEWNHCEFIVNNDENMKLYLNFKMIKVIILIKQIELIILSINILALPDQEYAINNVLELESILQKSEN